MNQSIPVVSGPIVARMTIPGSKSMTYRALMIASLADGVSELTDLFLNDDTLTFLQALREAGVMIELDRSTRSCIVGGCNGVLPRKEAKFYCQDALIPTRFL